MAGGASEAYEAILALVPLDFSDPGDPLERIRAKFAEVHGLDPGPGVDVVAHDRGVEVRPETSTDDEPSLDDRVVFFVHGGGFVTSPARDYTFWAAHVARRCGLATLVAEYRLAPETRFPDQLDDLDAAFDELIAGGHAPSRVVVMGDSCGGGMGLATLVRRRDRGLVPAGAFVGLGGWYDLEANDVDGPTGDPFVHPDWLRLRGRDYVGPDGDPAHPHASVVHADHVGMPPMLLQTGDLDPCLPGASRLAAAAIEAGVAVTVDVVPGVAQGFQGMADLVPEADRAWRSVAGFIERHVPRVM